MGCVGDVEKSEETKVSASTSVQHRECFHEVGVAAAPIGAAAADAALTAPSVQVLQRFLHLCMTTLCHVLLLVQRLALGLAMHRPCLRVWVSGSRAQQ